MYSSTSADLVVHPRDFVKTGGAPSRRLSQKVTCECFGAAEALAVGVISYLIFRYSLDFTLSVPLCICLAMASCLIAFLSNMLQGAHSYDGFISRRALAQAALLNGAYVGLCLLMAGAPLTFIVIGPLSAFSAVYVTRIPSLMFRLALKRAGLLMRLVAVVGKADENRDEVLKLLRHRTDIQIVAAIEPAHLARLRDLASQGFLDEIVLTDASFSGADFPRLAGIGAQVVRLEPKWADTYSRRKHLNAWNAPVTTLYAPPLRDWWMVAKRFSDLLVASVALAVLSPVMLLAAAAVCLESRGSAFFCQERFGHRGRPFLMLKFRTMYTESADLTGSRLTQRNDPRVTRVGAILRRTSIDELPQLLNVLAGDMSIVGPRPHPKGALAGKYLYDDLIPDFYRRYLMLPGLTGLAQISGLRGNTEIESHLITRFEKDMEYVMRWSPWFDMVIMYRTIGHLISGKNAF